MAIKAPPRILSRGEIHRRTQLSLAHISKIYSGKRRPSADALRKIAEAQKLTMEQTMSQIAVESARWKKVNRAR